MDIYDLFFYASLGAGFLMAFSLGANDVRMVPLRSRRRKMSEDPLSIACREADELGRWFMRMSNSGLVVE
jgi:hypothetical protein